MLLDCDDKNILTVRVNENMANQTETFMVEDGSNCTIRINNSTSSTVYNEIPIWYVDYTVYHGDNTTVENDPIVIRREQSTNNELTFFAIYPECYLDKLSDRLSVDTSRRFAYLTDLNLCIGSQCFCSFGIFLNFRLNHRSQ